MCNPWLVAGAVLAGGAVQGVGAARQAENEAVSQANQAEASDLQSHQVHITNAYQMYRLTDTADRTGGQIRAAVAEGGLEMTGSANDFYMDTADEIQLDLDAIRLNSRFGKESLALSRDISLKNSADARSSKGFAFLAPILGSASRIGGLF